MQFRRHKFDIERFSTEEAIEFAVRYGGDHGEGKLEYLERAVSHVETALSAAVKQMDVVQQTAFLREMGLQEVPQS